MKGRVEIRPLRIDDLRDIFTLGCEIFEKQAPPCLPVWNEVNLADVLIHDPGLCLIAAAKKRVVGFLIASLDDADAKHSARIQWLGKHDTQPMGLLTEMINTFKRILTERNIEKIIIALPESNTEIIEYYRNFGFTDSKRIIIMENFLPKKP